MCAAALLLLSLCAGVIAQTTTNGSITGELHAVASSGKHAWFLLHDPGTTSDLPYELYYRSEDMDAATAAPVRRLPSAPDHMLAVDGQLYFFTSRDDPAAGHDVFSLTLAHNTTFDVYYTMPRDRMELHSPLLGGRLVGLTEHFGAPVALIMPTDGDASSAEQPSDGPVAEPALLQLRTGKWEPLTLPESLDDSAPTRVGTVGSDARQLVLLQGSADPSATCRVFIGSGSGNWDTHEAELDLDRVRALFRAGGQLAVVTHAETDNMLYVRYLRQSGLIDVAAVDRPAGRWQMFGGQRSIHLVTTGEDGLQVMPIDRITGVTGEAQLLRVHETKGARVWFVALLLAGSVSVALLIVLIRPVPKEPVTLPVGLELLPPIQRLMAVLIDVFPAAVITLLVTRCSLAELLQAPLITPQLIMSWQYLLMIGLTMAHTTISELAWGTTLGKSMLGARVISLSGDRPRPGPCLLRAFGKVLTMLVLPIAVFAVLNRNNQGVNDLLGQTLVVHEPDEVEQGGDNR